MKTELSYLPPEAGLKAGQSHREKKILKKDSFQEDFIPEWLKIPAQERLVWGKTEGSAGRLKCLFRYSHPDKPPYKCNSFS